MEDLPLGRIAALVLEFAVKDLPLGRTHDDDDVYNMGQRVIGISGCLMGSKTLTELIFNPCGEFR